MLLKLYLRIGQTKTVSDTKKNPFISRREIFLPLFQQEGFSASSDL